MKIYVTGGNGMVGHSLIRVGRKIGHEMLFNTRAQLDLNNFNALVAYLTSVKPDLVIHAAGKVGGIKSNIELPYEFFIQNLTVGKNIVQACLCAGIPKLVNLGSSCMYPREAQNPLTEDQLFAGELEPTNEAYALAKLSVAKFCEYATRQYAVNYKTLIPCNMYGPWDKFDSNEAHLVPAVIGKLHHAKSSGQDVVDIWGSGNARREFMYVDDLSNFIFHALDSLVIWDSFTNVGLGVDYSINEYYSYIAEIVNYTGHFKHDLTQPEGMKQKLVSIKKQKSLNWSPEITLAQGIEKTYKFYIDNY